MNTNIWWDFQICISVPLNLFSSYCVQTSSHQPVFLQNLSQDLILLFLFFSFKIFLIIHCKIRSFFLRLNANKINGNIDCLRWPWGVMLLNWFFVATLIKFFTQKSFFCYDNKLFATLIRFLLRKKVFPAVFFFCSNL